MKLLGFVLLACVLLYCACSGGDSSAPRTGAANAAAATDTNESLRATALTFLDGWKSMDFPKMTAVIDPQITLVCELLTGAGKCASTEDGHESFQDWAKNPGVQPLGNGHVNICSGGEHLYPCSAYDITNVTDAYPAYCRDATPAEVANGYGEVCDFTLTFAERPHGSDQQYGDAVQCVVVQLSRSGPVVRYSGGYPGSPDPNNSGEICANWTNRSR